MFWYWEKGNPKARCSPDVFVAFGVEDWLWRSFCTWRENNTVPRVIFEITSKKTKKKDLTEKRDLYARLGVHEYFLFDPEAICLKPALQGFRLQGQELLPLEAATDGSLICQELGLRLQGEGSMLRLFDLINGPTGSYKGGAKRTRAGESSIKQKPRSNA